MPGPLLLVDSASMYFRSFHALPESMTAPDGRPHNAIRGFLQTLTRLLEAHCPGGLACCWDEDWRPDWRVELLPSYKTHRVAEVVDDEAVEIVPDTLEPQAQALAALIDSLGIARPAVPGFEADDCIGTLAAHAEGPVVVVSGDRDMVQLVDGRVRVHLAVNGGMEKWPLLDPDLVVSRYGVRPEQYVDLAVLRGDPSDGIPGVPGIGEKTAAKLLAAGSLDDVLAAVAAGTPPAGTTPRLAGALAQHRELIEVMRTVATIRRDVPWAGPTTVPAAPADPDGVARIAEEWGVGRFVAPLQAGLAALQG